MNRRDFLQASSAAGLAFSIGGKYASGFTSAAGKRVGLIGCGWYGKADLLRLVQVAPVEVVSLCDVDSRMLNDAAQLVATRQRNHERPRTFADYREMLRQRNLTIFPNLQVIDISSAQLRTWRPLAANKTEMVSHCLAPMGEPAAARALRARGALSRCGTSRLRDVET